MQQQVEALPWRAEVLVEIDALAQRMTDSDLAIGAAGTTSWERCCLGLPTLVVVLAENQKAISQKMVESGAAQSLILNAGLPSQLQNKMAEFVSHPGQIALMAEQASKISEGQGTSHIVKRLINGGKF